MRVAKLGWPRSWSSCCFVQEMVLEKLDAMSVILSNFSWGSEAWKEIESNLMPRNSMAVLGPSVLSSARGTPRVARAVFRQDRL